MIRILMVLFLFMVLFGCGQKGDLYLPPEVSLSDTGGA